MTFSNCLVVLLAGLSCVSNAVPHNERDQSQLLTVAHQTDGILSIALDMSSKNSPLRLLRKTAAGDRPGWLCVADDNLYSISRSGYPKSNDLSGGVFAFKKGHVGRELQKIGDVSSHGEGGCHCDVSPDGKTISAANIDGSTISVIPRQKDGSVGEATFTFHHKLESPGPGHGDSQIQSNPHQAAFHPSGKFLFVPDRGADLVYIYRVNDSTDVKQIDQIELPKGTGPRHVTFWSLDKTKSLMVLVGELDNTLRVFRITTIGKACAIHAELLQTHSTLGAGLGPSEPAGHDLASEVAITSNGKFMYVANRNTESFDSDFVGVFSFHPKDHETPMRWIGRNNTLGKIPRHISLSSDKHSRYLSVVHSVTNDLQVFERNEKSGLLERLVANMTFGNLTTDLDVGPMAVIWD